MDNLRDFIMRFFGIDHNVFLEALLVSGNARGYILGAVSELLLKQQLDQLGFDLERIREKWEGPKLHHGDYYIRKPGGRWFVLESKGVKSNSAKWHRLGEAPTDYGHLQNWFARRRRGEIGKWWDSVAAERKERILRSGKFNEGRIIETHFVSGTAGRAGRSIATPRKSEFHAVAMDLFLVTGRHEFIFVPSDELESSAGHRDHLKQNYLIDILVPDVDREPILPAPWSRDFISIFNRLRNPVIEETRQVDRRAPGEREAGIEQFWAED